MQVTIAEIMSRDPVIVRFRCSVGQATGHWHGALPTKARTGIYVELTIDEVLDWEIIEEPRAGRLWESGSEIQIVEYVEGVDSDDIAFVRIVLQSRFHVE